VVLLGRVITRLGTVPMVHDGIVENMFASDLAFLQDFYRQINAEGHTARQFSARTARNPSKWSSAEPPGES